MTEKVILGSFSIYSDLYDKLNIASQFLFFVVPKFGLGFGFWMFGVWKYGVTQ